MRPTPDIVSHFDQRIRSAIERPRMYARSAEELEATLILLDNLLTFCMSDPSDNGDGIGGYTQYLIHQGYGSASYCERKRLDGMPPVTHEEMAAFFATYLSTQHGQ